MGKSKQRYKNNSEFDLVKPTEEEENTFKRRIREITASANEAEVEVEQMLYPGDLIRVSEAASTVVKAMNASERSALEQDMKLYLIELVKQLDEGASFAYEFQNNLILSYVVKHNLLIFTKKEWENRDNELYSNPPSKREIHQKCYNKVLDYQGSARTKLAFSLDEAEITEDKTVSIYLHADNSEHVSFIEWVYSLNALTGKWTDDEGNRGVFFYVSNADAVRGDMYESLTHECIAGKGMSYLEPEAYTFINLCRELKTNGVEKVIIQCGDY